MRQRGSNHMHVGHDSEHTAGAFWKALALIMLVNGTLGLAAPRFLIRQVGADPDAESGMIYVLRMFGIRTLFIAIDLFRLPAQREQSLREGVVVHATDAGAAFTAAMLGQLPLRPALMATSISVVNTALAVLGVRAYARGRR